MATTRTTTIRQDAQQAAELDAVARVDGVSTSEAIRVAIAEHIEKRRRDPAFQERLQRHPRRGARCAREARPVTCRRVDAEPAEDHPLKSTGKRVSPPGRIDEKR